jgi:hypothetical protein
VAAPNRLDGSLLSYQLKHFLIDSKGNDLAQLLGTSQESDSLRRLIRLVFHSQYESLNLEEALTSELYNLMNGVDLSLRSGDSDRLVHNLIVIHDFHQEKL